MPKCPSLPLNERVDCFPDAGASKVGFVFVLSDAVLGCTVINTDTNIDLLIQQQQCEKRGCCWSPLDERNVPWCFFPTNHGYLVESMQQPSPYGQSQLQTESIFDLRSVFL